MKVAVIQSPPVLLDRAATEAKAAALIADVAGQGAELVVFPEAYLSGYPVWTWHLKAGADSSLLGDLYSGFLAAASDPAAGGLDAIRDAARAHRVTVVMGFNELSPADGLGTVFNSVAVVGPDGAILNIHRKLMPTNVERTIWSTGDARGLRVIDTPVGRIGTLICWENYMPLSRFALYAQGLDMLIAPTWDFGDSWTASMRHIAKEGGCWVISTATSLHPDAIPDDVPGKDQWAGDDWLCEGNALVVRPFGRIHAGPLPRTDGVLYADIDVSIARKAKRTLDVAGHYARPDLFRLEVDRSPRSQATFSD